MSLGRVHRWVRDTDAPLGGRIVVSVMPLHRLDRDGATLSGTHVRVHNAGWINQPGPDGAGVESVPLGDARPNALGDFLFDHGRGGPRVDKYNLRSEKYRKRYVDAARFGEVNAYYHLDLIANHVGGLLRELGAQPLPRVVARVNAHHAAVIRDGIRDGDWREEHWVPFEGGHYRLPSARNSLREFDPVSSDGEIHFGPGRHLLRHGALFDLAGRRYRHNAAHNAGVIYHEYGHHVCRHTADFVANRLRPLDRQSNLKTALDEGYCDYWAAAILDLPQIWVWHRSHVLEPPHSRSLTSAKTAADYIRSSTADPHSNGTIWAAALWDLRVCLAAIAAHGVHRADLLVLRSLLIIGGLPESEEPTRTQVRRERESLGAGLAALLQANEQLYEGAFRDEILQVFRRRGIDLATAYRLHPVRRRAKSNVVANESQAESDVVPKLERESPLLNGIRRHVQVDDIPESEDLFSGAALEKQLAASPHLPFSMIAVGDVMLGSRTTRVIASRGADHVFKGVAPLLHRAPIVFGNLEGPLARRAARELRTHSYRVRPETAQALAGAGFNVMTLANNHLLDCGRAGVTETLETLSRSGIAAVGAGADRASAHAPAILDAEGTRVGILSYYWNRRTAATRTLPGSAIGTPEALRADIGALRERVDRLVVSFHWGVPYEREPSTTDRDTARFAVECGADVVIGHHAHVVQPFELYSGCPIFYGVGNFAFGSANSRAEGLLIAIRFDATRTEVELYPVYVKNRDPRVDYQPKLLRGAAAARSLARLVQGSGSSGALLSIDQFRAVLEVPRPTRDSEPAGRRVG